MEVVWSNRLARLAFIVVLSVAGVLGIGGCAATSRPAPSERVSQPAEPIDAFGLLRAAADHEALYTLVGGLKPMSTGIWSGSFEVENPNLTELSHVRAALTPLRNEIWYADVQVFDNIHEGKRVVHAFVMHRAAFARMIDRFEPFWSTWGITACTHPSEVIAVVDRMPKADRWRGYGYLFGYPADAVDFFVEAGLAAEDGREVGPGKDRMFIHIPTYAANTGRFTYAVSIDHVPTSADKELAEAAEQILAAYIDRRGKMRNIRTKISELRRLNRRFECAAKRAAGARDTRRTKAGSTDAVLDTR
ncbi:MAG: hypothetical protein EA377_00595 [Phycisphaerales bacterium]|nr:MAG: hypothetical protein EA377_00595 [Phycisphaerales bacterium]